MVSPETWNYLHSIYGGGPEYVLNPNKDEKGSEQRQGSEEKENKTERLKETGNEKSNEIGNKTSTDSRKETESKVRDAR